LVGDILGRLAVGWVNFVHATDLIIAATTRGTTSVVIVAVKKLPARGPVMLGFARA
jgi:hypothetical protein